MRTIGKLNVPHIRAGLEDGRVFIEVEDTELFDFVEDFLMEDCGLIYDFVQQREGEPVLYTMFFPLSVSFETAGNALKKLDPKEIERVFSINNRPTSRGPDS